MDDDEVTAALAEERAILAAAADAADQEAWRIAAQIYGTFKARALLAAVEAVLKPHQPGPVTIFGSLCKRHENHRYFSITAIEAEDVRACPDCEATVYSSCSGCGHPVPVDACPVRAAITAELAGKPENGSAQAAATREDGEP